MALHVVSGAAYGHSSAWNQLEEIPPGHALSYVDSIRSVVQHLLIYFIFPKSFLRIPLKWFKDAKLAHDEFGKYIHGFLEDYKSGDVIVGGDSALKALVEHSVDAGGSGGLQVLSDEELVGNSFIILFGGHESTSVPQKHPKLIEQCERYVLRVEIIGSPPLSSRYPFLRNPASLSRGRPRIHRPQQTKIRPLYNV